MGNPWAPVVIPYPYPCRYGVHGMGMGMRKYSQELPLALPNQKPYHFYQGLHSWEPICCSVLYSPPPILIGPLGILGILTNFRSESNQTTWNPRNSDQLPTKFQVNSNQLLTRFRPTSDQILTNFWPNSEWIPTNFWPDSNQRPTKFRPNSKWIPSEFQPNSKRIPSYRIVASWMLTTRLTTYKYNLIFHNFTEIIEMRR